MAEAGNRVAAIDYRKRPDHEHPAASEDVAAAVDWVRSELGAEQVALAGSSSGGHLALHAALHLDRPVAGVIALWPPTHPLDRFRYATTKDDDHGRRLVRNTLAYFGDEAAMGDAAITRIVSNGEATNLPPVLLVHPTEDANVPRHISEDLVTAYRSAGGEIDVWWVEGQPHAFGHFAGPATDELVDRMVRRLSEWFGTAASDKR
jgi:acetyl esterase